MTDINVPLLRKAVEWVEAEAARENAWESQWVQGAWMTHRNPDTWSFMGVQPEAVCGTAYCVAGFVAQLLNPAYAHDEYGYTSGDDEPVHASEYAAQALGLSADQAHELFRGGNSPERIRSLAEEFVGGAL